eukprot:m.157714 g.157714  ORF g.157714 m.157714 type:complete len:284 (-) comp52970_c0_seq1:101-952(-)
MAEAEITAVAAACTVFNASLAFCQVGVFRLVGVHAGVRGLSSACGFLAFSLSTLSATAVYRSTKTNFAAIAAHAQAGEWVRAVGGTVPGQSERAVVVQHCRQSALSVSRLLAQPTWENFVQLAVHEKEVVVCVGGSIALFRLAGGRFRALLPSCLYKPGAFAWRKASIPANGAEYITNTGKYGDVKIGSTGLYAHGYKYGCHSCGRKNVANFIGDHMPPNKYAKAGQAQRLYPQCTTCSSLQSIAVRTDRGRLVTHVTSLRAYHLWLPVGPLLFDWLQAAGYL